MSLREFDQTKISDIREVMAVKNAVELKTMREAEARAMMDKMRTRW